MDPRVHASTLRVLRQLLGTREAADFAAPVDPVALNLPTYRDVVKHPMDLGTVLARLQGHQYATFDQVAADVDLVWYNCRLFNPAGTFIVKSVDRLEAQFNRLVVKAGLATEDRPKHQHAAAAAAAAGGHGAAGAPRPAGPAAAAPGAAAAAAAAPTGGHKVKLHLKGFGKPSAAASKSAAADKSAGDAFSTGTGAQGKPTSSITGSWQQQQQQQQRGDGSRAAGSEFSAGSSKRQLGMSSADGQPMKKKIKLSFSRYHAASAAPAAAATGAAAGSAAAMGAAAVEPAAAATAAHRSGEAAGAGSGVGTQPETAGAGTPSHAAAAQVMEPGLAAAQPSQPPQLAAPESAAAGSMAAAGLASTMATPDAQQQQGQGGHVSQADVQPTPWRSKRRRSSIVPAAVSVALPPQAPSTAAGASIREQGGAAAAAAAGAAAPAPTYAAAPLAGAAAAGYVAEVATPGLPISSAAGKATRKRHSSVSTWGAAALAAAAEAPVAGGWPGGSCHQRSAGDKQLGDASVAAAKAFGLSKCAVCVRTRKGQCGSLYAPFTCTNRAALGLPYLDGVTQQVVVPRSWTSSIHKLAAGPRVTLVTDLGWVQHPLAAAGAGAGGGALDEVAAAAQQAQQLLEWLEHQMQELRAAQQAAERQAASRLASLGRQLAAVQSQVARRRAVLDSLQQEAERLPDLSQQLQGAAADLVAARAALSDLEAQEEAAAAGDALPTAAGTSGTPGKQVLQPYRPPGQTLGDTRVSKGGQDQLPALVPGGAEGSAGLWPDNCSRDMAVAPPEVRLLQLATSLFA